MNVGKYFYPCLFGLFNSSGLCLILPSFPEFKQPVALIKNFFGNECDLGLVPTFEAIFLSINILSTGFKGTINNPNGRCIAHIKILQTFKIDDMDANKKYNQINCI